MSSYIPSQEDEKHLAKTLQYLRENLEGLQLVDVGSTAKGTWLKGTSDIDIYVICEDKKLTYENVKKLWSHGHDKKGQLTIWNFQHNGYDIDLVLVNKGFHKREDTMLHADYFNRLLTQEMKNEVRKAKAFFKTYGVYGAENGGIVGVAIETIIVQRHNLEGLCKLLIGPKPYLQDPTMTTERDLLASINGRRWKQIQEACKEYLAGKDFYYKPMTTNEFHQQYKDTHCTLVYRRKYDKGLDYQTITSTATKVSRMLRNQESEVKVDIDTYVDNEKVLLCYLVRPLELKPTKEVCVPPKYAEGFKEAHPKTYTKNGLTCAVVKRKITFPATYFAIEVGERMTQKGYGRI